MRPISRICVFIVFFAALLCASSALAGIEPHAGMMRFPDVSATHIVFVYADDIWIVPRSGGPASPLASPPGGESFPRFSADGRTIAFNGNYDGNTDIYTVPVEGGIPKRVTYHSSGERLCDWTFDNHCVFAMSGLGGMGRQAQLFTVPQAGGLPERLPVPYGGYGTVSGDGQWLAYTPRNRDFRTWKRYRGGWASDIWLFHLENHTSRKITDWEGTDTIPMWQGRTLYYLSDAGPNHRLNIWSYDLDTAERRQITRFKDYDVKWPSNGPGPHGHGEIIFEYDAGLYLLNLATEQTTPVNITIPGARPTLRPMHKDVSDSLSSWSVSPNAKRVLVEARGDIWSLPAKHGTPRNLTRTSGVAEREPSWSPDGKWITYMSDASGENELVIQSTQDNAEPETVTSFGIGYAYQPVWSPDSNWMVIVDHETKFTLFNLTDRTLRQFDRIDISGWRSGAPLTFSWSSDSAWLTYTKPNLDNTDVIMLYHVTSDESYRVTSGMFNDSLPAFDRKGDFLYFVSQRDITQPTSSDLGLTFVYRDTALVHAIPLREDVVNPFKARSDEEEAVKDDADKDESEVKEEAGDDPNDPNDPNDVTSDTPEKKKEAKAKDVDTKPIKIDLANMEQRAFRLPVNRGQFRYLEVNDKNQVVYLRRGEDGSEIQLFDPADEKHEEKTILKDASVIQMTPDGKRLLVRSGGRVGLIEAKPGQKLESTVVTQPMTVVIEPREEWRQIFMDAWRFMRDYFYDPGLHQVDWPAVRKQYSAMLDDCISRRDLGYVISEMISEINAGHTYFRGGDLESGPSRSIGYLGVDFQLDQGYYCVSQVYEGGVWDTDARSILHDLKPEEREQFKYIFAVNGMPVDTTKAPWAAFEGLAGQTVTLKVSKGPDPDTAIDVVVDLMRSEDELRYRHWVEQNRAYVDKASGGQVGYIHVPDTGGRGQRELFRQFYGQMNKAALIVDERWNGGGNIADRFVELLNRPIYLHIFERYEHDWRVPTFSHQGPKCMLINGESGSGGDIFPYLFRKAGLGKLIGMRTWGGVIGISRNPGFIDGGSITVPFITFYETDGTLTMEGHGVDPDMEVIDDPALMVTGGDPQLDAAIQEMLKEIKEHPYVPAKRPAFPDRSGMGIVEEHK
jgi:tricorn protease